MFQNSSAFWNWLATSSADPSSVALTVKGLVTAVIPLLAIIFHNPNFNDLPDQLYSIIVALFGIVAAVQTVVGLLRKVTLTLIPS